MLSALLVWLDGRTRGDRVILRLENLDPERCRPDLATAMERDLAWLGLDWDEVVEQSTLRAQHEAALDRLEQAGLLYPCSCTRADIRRVAKPAPDGGYAYGNRCREQSLPAGGWREAGAAVRARLPGGTIALVDEGGLDLGQEPAVEMGDPVLVRRDGAVAYQLAVVVDDAAAGVTRVVRGRDIAPSTPTQVLLHQLLGLAPPAYRHHPLLLEPHGDKLAKLHGAVGAPVLRARYSAPELCGLLAYFGGLVDAPVPLTPADLLDDFDWARVRTTDLAVRWSQGELVALD